MPQGDVIIQDAPATDPTPHDTADAELLRIAALPRWTVLVLGMLSPLFSIRAPGSGALFGLGAFVALLLWAAIATINGRRAKPDTAYETAPSPWRAVFWWLSPIVLLVPAAIVVTRIDQWVDEAPGVQEANDREIYWFIAVIAMVVIGIVCFYRPYAYLGRTIAWVGGDAGRARRWFWAPIFASLLAGALFASLSMALSERLQDDQVSNGDTLAVLLAVGATFLPTIVWLVTGNRAMRELESATVLTYDRRIGGASGEMDPNEIGDRFRMRAAMQAAGSSPES